MMENENIIGENEKHHEKRTDVESDISAEDSDRKQNGKSNEALKGGGKEREKDNGKHRNGGKSSRRQLSPGARSQSRGSVVSSGSGTSSAASSRKGRQNAVHALGVFSR